MEKAVVVGGGKVACRKVEGLLAAGAKVIVISPVLKPELEKLAGLRMIDVIRREYRDGDLSGAFLVIAATDNPQVNHLVWAESIRSRCLVNVVDDAEHSNFTLPAIVHRGEMSIAVSTGASSPALARRLRERLEEQIEPEYALLTEIMAELRPELIRSFPSEESRLAAAMRVIDSDILSLIKHQGKNAALIYARQRMCDE